MIIMVVVIIIIVVVVVVQFQSRYVLTQQPDSQSKSSKQYTQQVHVSVDKKTMKALKKQGDKIVS